MLVHRLQGGVDTLNGTIETGGILGIGDTDIVMLSKEPSLRGNQVIWQTSISRETLQQASDYNSERYADVDKERIIVLPSQ